MHFKTLHFRGPVASERIAERKGDHKDVRDNPPDGLRNNIRDSGCVVLSRGRVFIRDHGASGCALLNPVSSQSEGVLR